MPASVSIKAKPGDVYYDPGEWNITGTLTVNRIRGNLPLHGTSEIGFDTALVYPGGRLYGDDENATVLRFDPSVTGALIKTEEFGLGTLEAYWNADPNNGMFAPEISNLIITGRSGQQTASTPFRADGIQVEAINPKLHNLMLYEIPGVGIRLKRPGVGTPNRTGILETEVTHRIKNIFCQECQGGMIVESSSGDCQIDGFSSLANWGNGLEVYGSGTSIRRSHIWGHQSDGIAGFLNANDLRIEDAYWEAAWIGADLACSVSLIKNIYTGPGTCWHRNMRIQGNGNTVMGLMGNVRAEDGTWPDIAGLEFLNNTCVHNTVIGGYLNISGTSKGIILRGQRQKVDLVLGPVSTATGVRIPAGSACRSNHIIIRGSGQTPKVLDFTGCDLNTQDGMGNHFEVYWADGPVGRITYTDGDVHASGPTNYNLFAGNKITWNGQVLA